MTAPARARILDELVSGFVAVAAVALSIGAITYAQQLVGVWEQIARVDTWQLTREPASPQLSWWELLRPHHWGWALVGAAGLQLGLLAVAWRRARAHRRQLAAARAGRWDEVREMAVPGRMLEIACSGVLLVGLAIVWWQASMLSELPHVAKAPLYASWGREVFAFTFPWTLIAGELGALAVAWAAAVRQRMTTLRAVARDSDGDGVDWEEWLRPRAGWALALALGWVGVGLLPFCSAGWLYPPAAIERVADWQKQQELVQQVLVGSRDELAMGAGLLTFSTIVVVLWAWRSGRVVWRQRARLHEPRWSGRALMWPLLVGASCLLAAVKLHLLTLPFRAETLRPLPTGYDWSSGTCPDEAKATVTGLGPDPLTEMPVVEMSSDRSWVDRAEMSSPSELAAVLQRKKELWRSSHPDEPFPAAVGLALDPGVELTRLGELIASLHRVGYERAYLMLENRVFHDRAILGPLCGVHTTAVILRTSCGDGDGLTLRDFGDYPTLIEQLVIQRKHGMTPCLRAADES